MGLRLQKAPTAVLIFDWDDTICPSTFIEKFKVDSFTELPSYVSAYRFRSRIGHRNLVGSFCVGHEHLNPVNIIVQFFSHLLFPFPFLSYVQVRETFDHLAKCADRCLREASKYGEVRTKNSFYIAGARPGVLPMVLYFVWLCLVSAFLPLSSWSTDPYHFSLI